MLLESVLNARCGPGNRAIVWRGRRSAGSGGNCSVDTEPLDAKVCRRQENSGQNNPAGCAALHRGGRAAVLVQLSGFVGSAMGCDLSRKEPCRNAASG